MNIIKSKKFITNRAGNTTDVILDIKTYEKILEDLDELYCIRAYDKAKEITDNEIKNNQYITLKDYVAKSRRNINSRKLLKKKRTG